MTGSGQDKVGYKHPPKHTRFGAGNKANPAGKTSEQKKLEYENAEIAMRIRNRLLTALEGVLNEHPEKETIVNDRIKADILKLLKDSEDRGLGAPVQAVDHSSKDGTMSPKDVSSAVIDALKAKHGPKPD